MNSNLVLNKPVERSISDQTFMVSKVPYEHFDDAVLVTRQMDEIAGVEDLVRRLHASSEREAIERLIAGCLSIQIDGETRQLERTDLKKMPLAMVVEAFAVVLEVNLDFFIQTLMRLAAVARRMGPIGLQLLNSSSAQGTHSMQSGATASPSSEAS